MHLALLAAVFMGSPSANNEDRAQEQSMQLLETRTLTAGEMFDLAARAEASGDGKLSMRVLKALLQDHDVKIRNEARFRLAMLTVKEGRLTETAVLLRQILDEEPNAQRVRLELARVLELLGDETGARRALREVQASGLPPDVARYVDRYSAALRAQKPLGASLDFALAPDSNINRATRSQTLGTVIGDFILDEDAKQRSGLGLALRGQAFVRNRLSDKVNLLGRVSGTADIYKESIFNDLALAISGGPELRLGPDRLSLEAGGLWRWYSNKRYLRAATLGLSYFHPLDRKSQLRGSANIALIDNLANSLLSGQSFTAALGYERALSARAGAGVTLNGDRQALHDPGYSTWGAQLMGFGYREIGSASLVMTLTHGRLKADQRIGLYPAKRSDRLYKASLGATFRSLQVGSFAPFVRTSFERNFSSVEIYDYRRVRAEFGVTRAF